MERRADIVVWWMALVVMEMIIIWGRGYGLGYVLGLGVDGTLRKGLD